MAGRIALVGIVAVNLTASSAAWSGDPDPIQSTIPSVITLVGESAGVPDPRGTFQITLKDANQDHIPYTNVYVNLSSCGDPIPAQDQAGMLYGCNGVFTAKTNLAGIATFTIVGSTLHRQYMGAIPNCAVISADGASGQTVFLGNALVTAFDQDGANGLRGSDFRLFACDRYGGQNPFRSDYTGNGTVDGADLAAWLGAYFGSGSTNTGARCDGEPVTGNDVLDAGKLYLSATNGGEGTCYSAGPSAILTPDCSGAGAVLSRIIVSIRPSVYIQTPMAYEAEFILIGSFSQPSFPPFWDLTDQSAPCNAFLGVRVSQYTNPALDCPYAFALNGVGNCGYPGHQGALLKMDFPYGSQPVARIRVVGTVIPPDTPCAPSLLPDSLYALFGLDLDPAANLDPNGGACEGCSTPMALGILSVRINQPTGGILGCSLPGSPNGPLRTTTTLVGDMVMTAPIGGDSTTVFFNGVPDGYLVGVKGSPAAVGHLSIEALQPNPLSASGRILYRLTRDGDVTLAVFDIAGRRIRTLVRGFQTAGAHTVTWDGRDGNGGVARGGVFIVRLIALDGAASRTLIVRR